MSTKGEAQRGVQPDFDSFETDFDRIDKVLEGENSTKQLLVGAKEGLVDDFIHSEVLKDVAPRVIESLEDEMPGYTSDKDVMHAIKNGGPHGEGGLYEEVLKLAVREHATGDADFAYESVLNEVSPYLTQTVEQELDDASPENVVDALGNIDAFGDSEFYDTVLEKAVSGEDIEIDALDESIFNDKIEASDAFSIDYILRGGKRLRPFMTLLTEFGLEDGTSYKGAMVGTAQEIIHASSLEHDDDMDNDTLRRGKLTSERVNRALYGEGSWKQSVLDGNKVEAWGNEALNSIIDDSSEEFEGIPKQASKLFFQMEADLNDGQKRDIDMEDMQLREAELGDYEHMIAGKTGALFKSGVDIVVEDHLHDSEYLQEEREEIRGLFDDYTTSFNRLFQGGDDAIEVFRPENAGKSVTDIANRKITFPAIQTKDALHEQGEEYAELFLDVFDGSYDEVTEDMRETAADMGVHIQPSEDWEDEWLNTVINEYGEQASNEKADEYLETAFSAVDELYERDVINDAARQKYEQLAEFVWNRDH